MSCPVEPQYWEMPAFEGVIREGRIYGRGAVDMKGCGVMQLIAFLLLKRLKRAAQARPRVLRRAG